MKRKKLFCKGPFNNYGNWIFTLFYHLPTPSKQSLFITRDIYVRLFFRKMDNFFGPYTVDRYTLDFLDSWHFLGKVHRYICTQNALFQESAFYTSMDIQVYKYTGTQNFLLRDFHSEKRLVYGYTDIQSFQCQFLKVDWYTGIWVYRGFL